MRFPAGGLPAVAHLAVAHSMAACQQTAAQLHPPAPQRAEELRREKEAKAAQFRAGKLACELRPSPCARLLLPPACVVHRGPDRATCCCQPEQSLRNAHRHPPTHPAPPAPAIAADERGQYPASARLLEQALNEEGPFTQLGGEIQLWLALAYQASGCSLSGHWIQLGCGAAAHSAARFPAGMPGWWQLVGYWLPCPAAHTLRTPFTLCPGVRAGGGLPGHVPHAGEDAPAARHSAPGGRPALHHGGAQAAGGWL